MCRVWRGSRRRACLIGSSVQGCRCRSSPRLLALRTCCRRTSCLLLTLIRFVGSIYHVLRDRHRSKETRNEERSAWCHAGKDYAWNGFSKHTGGLLLQVSAMWCTHLPSSVLEAYLSLYVPLAPRYRSTILACYSRNGYAERF
jgi:hypothetical protein